MLVNRNNASIILADSQPDLNIIIEQSDINRPVTICTNEYILTITDLVHELEVLVHDTTDTLLQTIQLPKPL